MGRSANLVSLVDELVGARDRGQPVDVVELVGHLVAKEPAGTARAHGPGVDVFRVAPDQVAEGTLVGDLLGAGNDADLVDGADLGAQAAVNTQDGAVDNSGEDEKVKNLAACLPDRGVAVLLLAFFVETIYLRDLPRFVVAAN